MGCSATNQGLIVQKIIAEGKSKLFFRSIIVKNPEFFDGAGAGVGAGAENGIIFRLRLQQKSTAPGGSGSGSATLVLMLSFLNFPYISPFPSFFKGP